MEVVMNVECRLSPRNLHFEYGNLFKYTHFQLEDFSFI